MFTWTIKIIFYPLLWLFFKPKIYGTKFCKVNGGVILMSNHVNLLDPIFLGIFFRRRIYFMAKKELFKNPFLRWLIKMLGAFPVDRGKTDIASIKRAMAVVKQGKVLGIFPEGKRVKTGELGNFEQGTAMLAMKLKCPIIPVYTDGNYGIFKRAKLVFGEAFYLQDVFGRKVLSENLGDISSYLKDKIQKLKDQVV
ncbi:MAG: 1-acylglycerol-3-phosphate O-acyltransferase [Eubacteriales bacterium]